jgi:putative hydrolase of HD superfamily
MLPLSGKRIILRDWQFADLDRYGYWLRPGHRWQELDGPYDPRPTEAAIEQMLARLRETLTARQVTDSRRQLVIADRASNELLGRVSWYWQSEETQWLSLGIDAISNVV